MSAHSVGLGRVALRTRSDVQKKRRYPEGLCQQCGSPDISPRSATGVRCTPCLDRASELKKARRAATPPEDRDVREKERLAAGLCRKCGNPNAANRALCEAHLESERRRLNERTKRWTDTDITRHLWSQMRQRCTNPKCLGYPNYGGRGIKVCERWGKFKNFVEDMGIRPSPELSIERKDVNGDYEPSNCYWATLEEQMNNRQDSHKLTIDGETLTIAQWSRRTGVRAGTIHGRLKRGLPPELAVSKEGTRVA